MADDQSVIAATAAVQAVTDNASRLGLTWDLRPATVSQVDATNGITVTIDGDKTPVTATSMIGSVYFGERVYVLLIPPGGVFIAGIVGSVIAGIYRRRIILTTGGNSADFFSLPLLSDIRISYIAKGSAAVTATDIRMRINGISSGSYNTENVQAIAGAITASLIDSGNTSGFVGSITGTSASATAYGFGNIWFHAPDQSVNLPSWTYHNANLVSGGIHETGGGLNTAGVGPVTKIQLIPFSGSFIAGSTFTLEGTLSTAFL